MFQLQFPPDRIRDLAARYDYGGDELIEREIVPFMRREQCLNREYFRALCRWKSPRPQPLVARNSEKVVREVTRIALTTRDEHLRIHVLQRLEGVGWPTAYAILHFGFPD